jgi:hypothetical protein
MLTVKTYVVRRLGKPHGPWQALGRMVTFAFAAPSFAAFWYYWNPVYGYYLYYWAYRPLRRVVPRAPALVLTFATCGFLLHDLPHLPFTGIPLITTWFVVLSIGVLLGEAVRMDLSRRPRSMRVVVNAMYLVTSFEVARRLSLMLFRT